MTTLPPSVDLFVGNWLILMLIEGAEVISCAKAIIEHRMGVPPIGYYRFLGFIS